MMSSLRQGLPTYQELIYPTLKVVGKLGGSARGAEYHRRAQPSVSTLGETEGGQGSGPVD